MKQKSFLLIFIAVIGLAAYSFGQNYSTIPTDSIHGFISPGGLMDTVLDNFGNKYNLRDIKIDSVKSILGGTQKSTTLISCNSGYFNLYFESGSGMEGTDSVQSARRNVICQVFSDISAFINSPLTTTGNKVNIWIRDINQIFGIGVVNHYLGLSTPFYNVPYNYFNTKGGIADNEVWKTIHRGVDSYAGVMPPIFTQGNQNIYDGITFYHGMMAFNFNNISGVNVFNWNTNLSLQYSPSNYYDLYTVILHEAIHTLGIVSLISQFGTSKFNPQYNYYSRYDLQLKNHSLTQNLITNDSACSFYNYQFNPILDSLILQPGCPISGIYPNDTADCLNTLMYSGSVNMPVYTPTCFESSSSLSHFEDLCYPTGAPYGNNQYFVMSNAQDIGAIGTKRYLKPEERLVLCDIGYNTNSVFGDTTNHNYYNYNTATCFGINIAGINDVFFGVINNPIQITHILQNDTNAATFECLEDIFYSSPTSNLSATSGYDTSIINFTTSQAGIHLLRYIPVASSGQRGNITYIFVYLYSSDTNCLPTCSNLISNGNFETLTYPIDHDEPFIFNQVCGWYVERFTPQINPPNTSLNHTALIRADPKSFENPYLADGQNLYHESIGQFINIQPGNYKLNFDYKLGYLDSLLNK